MAVVKPMPPNPKNPSAQALAAVPPASSALAAALGYGDAASALAALLLDHLRQAKMHPPGAGQALEEVGQFEAAFARHADEPAARWAEMTPFPWLASLEPEGVREFRADLLPHLLLAVHQGDLEPHLGNLRAWESTAETVNDVEMMAQMLAPIDSERLAELYPPEIEGDRGTDEDASTAT